jgi:hypothetical protein
MKSVFTKVSKTLLKNNIYVINGEKIPCYSNVTIENGNESGMIGEIAFQKSTGTFYGHNGINWSPLGGSGGGSIWTLNNTNDFIQDTTQTLVQFDQNNLLFGQLLNINNPVPRLYFIAKNNALNEGAFRAGSTLLGGDSTTGVNSAVFGTNNDTNSINSIICSGTGNVITGSISSAIITGTQNTVENSSVSFIGSGFNNSIGIQNGCSACAIVAGTNNNIGTLQISSNSTILCGTFNVLNGSNSSILAGSNLSNDKDNTALTQRFQTLERVQHKVIQISVPGPFQLDNTHHFVVINSGNITVTLPQINPDVEGQELYILTRFNTNSIVTCFAGDVISNLGSTVTFIQLFATTPGQFYSIHLIATTSPSVWVLNSKVPV